MSRKLRVLTVCPDRELQLLRRALLQQAGYEVVSPEDDDSALAAIDGESLDAMLLCYQLSTKWANNLAERFRLAHPHGRIVAVLRSNWHSPPVYADEVVCGMDGPERMIAAISARTKREG
jgi:CheY-like chemotaxis protein